MTTTTEQRSAEDVLRVLRTKADVRQLIGGFGPLVLAAVLVVLMILLAPSVAPEQIVERPVETTVDAETTPTTGEGGG